MPLDRDEYGRAVFFVIVRNRESVTKHNDRIGLTSLWHLHDDANAFGGRHVCFD